MVPLMSLWMPIVLAAVLVFIASSLIHMVLKYHDSDYGSIAKEDELMDALRQAGIPSGDYVVPCPSGAGGINDPEFKEKWSKGPVAFLTVLPNGPMSMGPQLAQWFVYCLAVGAVSGYVAGRAVGPGADYLAVFRFAGTTAFTCYAVAFVQQSIWYHRRWSSTLKSMFDGLVYALLTAGCFGWLWPS